MSKKSTRHPDREDRKFEAIIAEFIDGYMDHDEAGWDVKQNYVNVACIAWNIAELALHEQEKAIHAYLDIYRTTNPGSMESTLSALEKDIRALIDWKLEKFASAHGTVVEARLTEVNGKASLAVVSVPSKDT